MLAKALAKMFVCTIYVGLKEVSKIDCDTKNVTVKRLAALKTFPTTIEVL